ncbi:hypothetical protein [Streptomyces graminilatus]|uniref:hypothetical protein n=1 Tax=Streptomyces graminilatus TaxID=1464070 RepID=UPI0006E39F8B|nr:hypothetical protein [Streptomyces graminilatus]
MTDNAAIDAGLRRFGVEGRSASEAARWAIGELGRTADTESGFPVFQLMFRFFSVFHVSVQALRELECWEGLGIGGPLTDAELDAVIGPLRVRETPLS